MEIGPVTGIPVVPPLKAQGAKSGRWAAFDIENQGHANDETYTPSDGEASGGDDNDSYEPKAESEESVDSETPPAKDEESGQVSFFA